MRPINILALPKYGRLGSSSRLRQLQYLPWLTALGMHVTVQTLLSDELLLSRYRDGGYRRHLLLLSYRARLRALRSRKEYDLLWIEKESLPWWPRAIESLLLSHVPYVLDFDDAVFHNYDLHKRRWVRTVFGKRLDGLMSKAAAVVVGNQYLAERARQAGAPLVVVVPTVIDLDRYKIFNGSRRSSARKVPSIVWVGAPTSEKYLSLLQKPLQLLAARRRFVFRVIGGKNVYIPGVDIELVAWSEETEVLSIQEGDIGVMPLEDTPWERGKCGYKLVQYMACGLPVVASSVGVNTEIVTHGVNGFLARTCSDWVMALDLLLGDCSLRATMGRSGRDRVESHYCIQKTGPVMAELLRSSAIPKGKTYSGKL